MLIHRVLCAWRAYQLARRMRQQFAAAPSAAELEERDAWRRIQRASAIQILGRHSAPEEK
jgi:hypothetical protein